MDEDSIIDNAIKYLKELQEKVKTLEDEGVKNTVKSTEVGSSSESLHEIEVKLSKMVVLIRIHCDNQRGILAKMLHEVETLHLNIVSVNAIPFTNTMLDVTITAKMEDEFSMTKNEIVTKLISAFKEFMSSS